MFTFLLRLFSKLSLRWNHRIGALLGRFIYKLDHTYAKRLRENLAISKIAENSEQFEKLVNQNISESGKAVTEVIIAWLQPPENVAQLVKDVRGWEDVDLVLKKKKPIIFVTPHLGCFDIAGRYISNRLPTPLTAMYSAPKLAWAEKLMNEGRERMNTTMAPANMRGVRMMLKTLKEGGYIFILPDQVPKQGDGVWANFFGKPAYTMTLIGRLQHSTDAAVFMFFGERLENGQGYRLWIEPLNSKLDASPEKAALQINTAVEKLIVQCPTQYLWSYNRYKKPAGANKNAESNA